ncbi:MAG: hypothetical protein L0Z70_05615 [Chloroflexi bacterium]|nr:hypothetical protein [Chloroflexota bacterium]
MTDTQDKKVMFLPFHALNEFMTSEYRQEVVRRALNALPDLPENLSAEINRQTGKSVRIQGFRNSLKAPAALRFKPTLEAFEKSPALVAAILAAWAETHPDLRQQVYALLQARQWELLPIDADRARLPGFITVWPKGEDFEALNRAFSEMYPEARAESNDVSLMVVWLSLRLPYAFSGDEASA